MTGESGAVAGSITSYRTNKRKTLGNPCKIRHSALFGIFEQSEQKRITSLTIMRKRRNKTINGKYKRYTEKCISTDNQ